MKNQQYKVLIVEDVQSKYEDVLNVLRGVFEQAVYTRATHLNEAEDLVMLAGWDLIVLDLSMDISAAGSVDLSSGHATLGGLDILERMALLKLEMPTVLVTGFDSFQDPDRFDNAIMNLADLQQLARKWLRDSYLGSIRYGAEDWSERFRSLLAGWREQ